MGAKLMKKCRNGLYKVNPSPKTNSGQSTIPITSSRRSMVLENRNLYKLVRMQSGIGGINC